MVPFYSAEGWAKKIIHTMRHFSRRDRMTLRMRTPPYERLGSVCDKHALNRFIARYVMLLSTVSVFV
jgi:hypothetical protein